MDQIYILYLLKKVNEDFLNNSCDSHKICEIFTCLKNILKYRQNFYFKTSFDNTTRIIFQNVLRYEFWINVWQLSELEPISDTHTKKTQIVEKRKFK